MAGDFERVVPEEARPTDIMIGRGYTLWIWVCPADLTHPAQETAQ